MTVQTHDQSAEMVLERIDAIMHELGELRRMILRVQIKPAPENLAQQLYGALGQGSWEEYDQHLDWQRFGA
jgi:hypothetical protein